MIFGIPSFAGRSRAGPSCCFVITRSTSSNRISVHLRQLAEQERHLVHKTIPRPDDLRVSTLVEARGDLAAHSCSSSPSFVAVKRRDPRMLAPLSRARRHARRSTCWRTSPTTSSDSALRYWIVGRFRSQILLVGSLVAAWQTAAPGPVDDSGGNPIASAHAAGFSALWVAPVLVLALMIPSGREDGVRPCST